MEQKSAAVYVKVRDGKSVEYEVVKTENDGWLSLRNAESPSSAPFKSTHEKLIQSGYTLKPSGDAQVVQTAEGVQPVSEADTTLSSVPVTATTEAAAELAPPPAVVTVAEEVVAAAPAVEVTAQPVPKPAEPVVSSTEAPKKRTRAGSATKSRMVCEYFIICFMPSAERGERANVGIAVTSDDRFDVRFSGMAKAEALAPGYDMKAWKRDQGRWNQFIDGTFSATDEADYESKVDGLLTKYVI